MKVGVTGIFASGKGTVCRMFEDLGAGVIDTDILAREIVEPGSKGLDLLVREFGQGILNNEGTLDRRGFGMLVFKDPEKVKRLNAITHPLILDKTLALAEEEPGRIYMVNTPLLFESGFYRHMEKNIVVTADTGQVIHRGMQRDHITAEEIEDRLKNQISLNEKIRMADYVIDNSGTLDNTKRQVISLWNILTTETRTR